MRMRRRLPLARSRSCSAPRRALLVACGGGDGRIPASDASSADERAEPDLAPTTAPADCAAAQRAVAKAQNAVLAPARHGRRAACAQRLQSGIEQPRRAGPAPTCSQAQTQTHADPDRHDARRDTTTTDTATTDTGTTETAPPATDTATTATTPTGDHAAPADRRRRPGTDTGTGGTSVGGATTP